MGQVPFSVPKRQARGPQARRDLMKDVEPTTPSQYPPAAAVVEGAGASCWDTLGETLNRSTLKHGSNASFSVYSRPNRFYLQ